MNQLAPIAIFAFNRPDHLRRTIEALATNDLAIASHVTIFCDGPRDALKYPNDAFNCVVVRDIAHKINGFASVTVVERSKNMGCAASVIDGLTQMFATHENLIVIEDDVVCSPHTLAFLNAGITRYAMTKQVFAISAWSLPPHRLSKPDCILEDLYAVPRFNCSGGWASWRDRFEGIDWEVNNFNELRNNCAMQRAYCAGGDDLYPMLAAQIRGEIDAWDIRADWWRFQHGQVGINPFFSYTTNIGFGSGTHTIDEDHSFDNELELAIPTSSVRWLNSFEVNNDLLQNYKANYAPNNGVLKSSLLPIKHILAKLGLLHLAKKLKRTLLDKAHNAHSPL